MKKIVLFISILLLSASCVSKNVHKSTLSAPISVTADTTELEANITVTDTSEERLVNFNNYLKSLIPKSDRIKVFGPAPAPITKIRNRYRYKFLIKANKTLDIQKFIENWVTGIKKPNSIRLSVDIDPYNFL